MEQARLSIKIFGRVQAVSLRYNIQKKAQKLGLRGWIRNALDGTVEGVLEGSKDKIDQILAWLEKGPGWARVEKIVSQKEEYREEFFDFQILKN